MSYALHEGKKRGGFRDVLPNGGWLVNAVLTNPLTGRTLITEKGQPISV